MFGGADICHGVFHDNCAVWHLLQDPVPNRLVLFVWWGARISSFLSTLNYQENQAGTSSSPPTAPSQLLFCIVTPSSFADRVETVAEGGGGRSGARSCRHRGQHLLLARALLLADRPRGRPNSSSSSSSPSLASLLPAFPLRLEAPRSH